MTSLKIFKIDNKELSVNVTIFIIIKFSNKNVSLYNFNYLFIKIFENKADALIKFSKKKIK